MPGKVSEFGTTLYDLITRMINSKIRGFSSGGRLNLGGGEGEDGGVGGPPSTIIGQLTQTKVAYDTTQAETPELYAITRSGWENSLLDNLNHMRYWQKPARWFEPIFDDTYSVTIRGGIWWRGSDNFVDFVEDSIAVTAPDILPRIDIIYVNTAGGLEISEGTPSDTPNPYYPSGTAILNVCEVYIKASGDEGVTIDGLGYLYQSEYAQGYLQKDVRPFFGATFDVDVTGAQFLADLQDVSSTLPDDHELLMWDDGVSLWRPAAMLGGIGGGQPVLQVDGPIVPLTHVGGAYICTREGNISQIYIYCEETGSAGATIVDVNLNFATIFDTPGDRPSLAYNDANKVQKSVILSEATFTSEDLITIDIDEVATGAKGLTVVIALDVPAAGSTHPHSDGPHTGVLHLDELQDGSISGYPLLSDGQYPAGEPRYGQVGTVGIQNTAVTDTKAGNRVAILPKREGGHATNWIDTGTTIYTPELIKIQVGSYFFDDDDSHPTWKQIGFPEAFSAPPLVFVSRYGTGAGATYVGGCKDITATGFILGNPSSAGNDNTVFWMAVGPR